MMEESKVKENWKRLALSHAAFSDKSIPEIKKRLVEIKEAVEADPEFWEEFLPGLTKEAEGLNHQKVRK